MKHNSTLLSSFLIQARVVGALLMREILTRFGRHNVGFLWIFLEPMSFTLGITALWNILKISHGDAHLSITTFAVTGYSTILMWRNCANRCAIAVTPNHSLMYHRNVRVMDIFLSRALLEIAGATMSFIILTVIFSIVGLMDPPADILMMICGWVYLAIFSVGLGFTVGVVSELSETFDRVWHTIAYLLFPISGSAFMVEWLPKSFQRMVLWIPMVHASEVIRGGYYGPLVKPFYSPSYMVVCALVSLFVGLLLVRYLSVRITPESSS
ncbi:ABC transporter permease [Paraburkholderia sp. CI3]|uniref:ABC transporter permease n=1 Tax=Paraburkholderia sp. CI3 TaxID=2991060 RepID=UPI003D23CD1F